MDPESYKRGKLYTVKNKFCIACLTESIKLINDFGEKVRQLKVNTRRRYECQAKLPPDIVIVIVDKLFQKALHSNYPDFHPLMGTWKC